MFFCGAGADFRTFEAVVFRIRYACLTGVYRIDNILALQLSDVLVQVLSQESGTRIIHHNLAFTTSWCSSAAFDVGWRICIEGRPIIRQIHYVASAKLSPNFSAQGKHRLPSTTRTASFRCIETAACNFCLQLCPSTRLKAVQEHTPEQSFKILTKPIPPSHPASKKFHDIPWPTDFLHGDFVFNRFTCSY